MKRFLIEAGSLLILAAFIYFLMRDQGMSGIDARTLEERLIESGDLKEGKADSGLLLRQNLGLEADDYKGWFYYPPAEYMDVDEILVIEAEDSSVFPALTEAVEARLAERKETFENYGTYQYQRLCDAQIYNKDNYFVYIVAEDSKGLLRKIRKEIEE